MQTEINTRRREFRVIPDFPARRTGVASAARAVPANLTRATRGEIRERIEQLPIGGVAHFDVKRNRAADNAGFTAVTVERTA